MGDGLSIGNFDVKKYSSYSLMNGKWLGNRNTKPFADASLYGLLFATRKSSPGFYLADATIGYPAKSHKSVNSKGSVLLELFPDLKEEYFSWLDSEDGFFTKEEMNIPPKSDMTGTEDSLLWSFFQNENLYERLANGSLDTHCSLEVQSNLRNEMPFTLKKQLLCPDEEKLTNIITGFIYIIATNLWAESTVKIYKATSKGFENVSVNRSNLQDAPTLSSPEEGRSSGSYSSQITITTNHLDYYIAYSEVGIEGSRLEKIVNQIEHNYNPKRFHKIDSTRFRITRVQENQKNTDLSYLYEEPAYAGESEVSLIDSNPYILYCDPISCAIQIISGYCEAYSNMETILCKEKTQDEIEYLNKCIHKILSSHEDDWFDYLQLIKTGNKNEFREKHVRLLALKELMIHLSEMATSMLCDSYTHEYFYDYESCDDETRGDIRQLLSSLISIMKSTPAGREKFIELESNSIHIINQYTDEYGKSPTSLQDLYEYDQETDSSISFSIFSDIFLNSNIREPMLDGTVSLLCRILPGLDSIDQNTRNNYLKDNSKDFLEEVLRNNGLRISETEDSLGISNHFLQMGRIKKWEVDVNKSCKYIEELNTIVSFIEIAKSLQEEPEDWELRMQLLGSSMSVANQVINKIPNNSGFIDGIELNIPGKRIKIISETLGIIGDLSDIAVSIIRIKKAIESDEQDAAVAEVAGGLVSTAGLGLTIAGIVTTGSFTIPSLILALIGIPLGRIIESSYPNDDENWLEYSSYGVNFADTGEKLVILKSKKNSTYWTEGIQSWEFIDQYSAYHLYHFKPEIDLTELHHFTIPEDTPYGLVNNAYMGALIMDLSLKSYPVFDSEQITITLKGSNPDFEEEVNLINEENCLIRYYESDFHVFAFFHLSYDGKENLDWDQYLSERNWDIPDKYKPYPITIPQNAIYGSLDVIVKMKAVNNSDFCLTNEKSCNLVKPDYDTFNLNEIFYTTKLPLITSSEIQRNGIGARIRNFLKIGK